MVGSENVNKNSLKIYLKLFIAIFNALSATKCSESFNFSDEWETRLIFHIKTFDLFKGA